jgi:hypothetical protein
MKKLLEIQKSAKKLATEGTENTEENGLNKSWATLEQAKTYTNVVQKLCALCVLCG